MKGSASRASLPAWPTRVSRCPEVTVISTTRHPRRVTRREKLPMLPILDDSPYPWHDPNAVKLHKALYEIHPDQGVAVWYAQRAELQPARIDKAQPPSQVWKDILDFAAPNRR